MHSDNGCASAYVCVYIYAYPLIHTNKYNKFMSICACACICICVNLLLS